MTSNLSARAIGGITPQFPSFVCALTQFLGSSDLRQLERVSKTDKTALDTLWNTCARLYQKYGETPPCVRLLRQQAAGDTASPGGPSLAMCRPYLWSIACARIQSHFRTCGAHVCSFLVQDETAHVYCRNDCPFCHYFDEYVIRNVISGSRLRHHITPGSHTYPPSPSDRDRDNDKHALTCGRLRYMWGQDILNRVLGANATTGHNASKIAPVLLWVLIRHGEDMTYCYIFNAKQWATLWFALDVAARLPLYNRFGEMGILQAETLFPGRIDRVTGCKSM